MTVQKIMGSFPEDAGPSQSCGVSLDTLLAKAAVAGGLHAPPAPPGPLYWIMVLAIRLLPMYTDLVCHLQKSWATTGGLGSLLSLAWSGSAWVGWDLRVGRGAQIWKQGGSLPK